MQDAMEPLQRRGEEKLYSSAFVFARKCLTGNGKILRANAAFFEGMQFFFFAKKCNVSRGNAKVFQANTVFFEGNRKRFASKRKASQGNVNAAAFFGGTQNFGERMQRFSGEYESFASKCKVSQQNAKALWTNAKFCERRFSRNAAFFERMQIFGQKIQSFSGKSKSFTSERNSFGGKAQKFCQQMQSFSAEHGSVANKCKLFWEKRKVLRANVAFFEGIQKVCQ